MSKPIVKTPPHPRAVIVSIHDVSQHTTELVSKILIDLSKIGVKRTSLLVIPDHHRKGRIGTDSDVAAWLHLLERDGHELVAHGFYHRRERRAGETFRDKLVTRFYTADEGEFFDLSQFEAERKLSECRRALREVGVSSRGFIPPAWLLSDGAELACKQQGFDYVVRFDSVTDLANGKRFFARSLVYSTRAAWRRSCSVLFNGWLFRKTAKHELLRISIHPPDITFPKVWQQILALTAEAVKARAVQTYLEWVMERRRDP